MVIRFISNKEIEFLPENGLEESFLEKLHRALDNGEFTMRYGRRTVYMEATRDHMETPFLKLTIK